MTANDRMDIVDRNLLAAVVLLRGNPGITKSKLYFTERGRHVIDWMISEGFIEMKGPGCYLSEKGEEFAELCTAAAHLAGQDDDVESLIISIKDRYNKRLDLLRKR